MEVFQRILKLDCSDAKLCSLAPVLLLYEQKQKRKQKTLNFEKKQTYEKTNDGPIKDLNLTIVKDKMFKITCRSLKFSIEVNETKIIPDITDAKCDKLKFSRSFTQTMSFTNIY